MVSIIVASTLVLGLLLWACKYSYDVVTDFRKANSKDKSLEEYYQMLRDHVDRDFLRKHLMITELHSNDAEQIQIIEDMVSRIYEK